MLRKSYGIGLVLSGVVHAVPLAFWGWGGISHLNSSDVVVPINIEFIESLPEKRLSLSDVNQGVKLTPKAPSESSRKETDCQNCDPCDKPAISITDLMAGNPKPIYPEEARLLGIQGTVIVHLKIESGLLVECQVRESPHELLSHAAKSQLKQWTFPKSCGIIEVTVPIEFVLD